MTRELKKTLKTALTVVNTALIATVATASTAFAGEVVTVTIPAAQLETVEGTKAVYAKLQAKAKRECKTVTPGHHYKVSKEKACAADLLDQFIQDVQNETLTRIHAGEILDARQFASLDK